ncbi:MAG TPA: zinc transporter ZupT [Deltaproteobacteria bacterium]|nr:zinc transporter ZupT [bacterium]RKY74767.1 MAG: zinc transporter ZupT [candidate division KSB1 bacterium]RKY81878.1 MAG: zinc transporter ZupT [candidate division KSB1 bacterium]HDM75288.1 zinc transporter ZupT [Deltaproteobacteria bacterium]
MEHSRVGIALLLTAGAGLATTIGSLLGLAVRKPGARFMGFTLGFSAGVMVLVSFVELLQGSIESIGFLSAHLGFFIGMASIFLIDFLVPHEYIGQHDYPGNKSRGSLMRTGMLVAFGIGIHNFPEGMATFAGALQDVRLGTAIAVAIAIHNIPEGLAVSAPVYTATGSRGKAFLWSFLSGISEPVGAGLAALVLLPFLTPTLLGWLLAVVAGIMVAISLDEIVPAAKSFGSEHTPIVGVIAGMLVMAFSLWMLK